MRQKFTLSIDKELLDVLKATAKEHNKTLSGYIRSLILKDLRNSLYLHNKIDRRKQNNNVKD
jgi:hypothetical protein